MATGQVALIDAIPGGRDAVNYLFKMVADFQRVPQRLQVVAQQAQVTKQAADAKQDGGSSAEAAGVLDIVERLRAQHDAAAVDLADVMTQLQQSGLLYGMFDTIYAAVTLAAKVQLVLAGTGQVEQASQQVATKVLGAAGAMQFGSQGITFGKAVIGGILLFIGFKALRRARGTRKW